MGCLLIILLCVLLLLLPWIAGRGISRPGKGFACCSGPIPLKKGDIRLLIDSTAYDAITGQRIIRQEIFDSLLSAIKSAEKFIYVDFFLWNDWQGAKVENHRQLSSELSDALAQRKKEKPGIDILVLTDPINRFYGNAVPEQFDVLVRAGIPVIFTDLNQLPDSNIIYARLARFYGPLIRKIPGAMRWLEQPRFRNMFTENGGQFSGLQMARLLFFKANHRKVLICDRGMMSGELRMIVSSLNPSDSSSAHSNIGLQLDGSVARAALRCELACVTWSAENGPNGMVPRGVNPERIIARMKKYADQPNDMNHIASDGIYAEWLTEDAIQQRVVEMLQCVEVGDQVRIAMFYLSDEVIVKAIKRAIYSGASLQLLLDPNKDAFGRTKNGIPNRPVAAEIIQYAERMNKTNATIRWADTRGEQFHPKAMSITGTDGKRNEFLCGSANWTRRNIGGFNLEADVYVRNDITLNRQFNAFFDKAWDNDSESCSTVDWSEYAENGINIWFKKRLWYFQERTGAGTF